MDIIKIPVTWLDSKYIKDLDVMGHMLMRHLLGAATEHYQATIITRGTMINIDEFFENSYIRKPIKTRKKKLNDGLNKLINEKIIEEFRLEEGHIVVTFNQDFLKEIYPDMPEIKRS